MRPDDDLGYEPPTKDQVADALLVLGGDDQHRRLFYQGLQNPLWVEPLDELGAFNEVPAPFQDADGYFRSKVWSEGEYLVRMAEYVPSRVTPILVRMAETEDPFARRMIVAAAARLDGENAAKISKIVGRYLTSDRGRLVPPEEIARIIEALMTDGKRKHALKLASRAFGPRKATDADGSGAGYGRNRVVTGIEDYAYGETLAAVSIAMAPLGIKWLGELRRWLQRYQVLARSLQVADGDDADGVESDLSYSWRPSIPAHEQNHEFDEVGNGLVDALRDASTGALTDGLPVADVIGPLMSSRQPLLRRIGIHTITVAIGLGLGDAQTLAADVLTDELYFEVDYRHEYAEFARQTLPLATTEVVTTWTRSVLDGPSATDEEIRGWLAWRYEGSEVPQDEVDERRRTWQMRILSAIGTGLPGPAAERLTELQAEFGEWEHADFPSYVSSWSGEAAPADMDEIASWSIPEVVEFLRSWSEPTEIAFRGPSYGGVTFAFAEDVKSRPVEYAEAAGLFAETDVRYIASLFNALRTVADSGVVFTWAPVVRLGAALAEVPAVAFDGAAGGRRTDLTSLHGALLSMLQGGLSAGGETKPVIDVDAWPGVVRIVSALASDSDPTPEHEIEYGGSNMDPLTLSMNTVRPSALRTAARLARFSSGKDERGTQVPEVNRACLDVLDRRLGSDLDSSLTVAAVYGEALSSLAWSNPDWTRDRLSRLFDGEPDYASVVLSTVLAAYSPSLFLLDLLRPWLPQWLERLASDQPVKVGYESRRSATESLGDHLVLLAARGEIEFDDPLLVSYFARADVASRSSVLGHLGWMLLHSRAPNEFLARARAIWDWRAEAVQGDRAESAELSGFYWWVRCGQFEPSWWMPRLIVASRVPGFDGRGMIGEQIAEAAQDDPRAAFDVLAGLLASGEGEFERYDLIENTPAVLAAALDLADPDLTERAEALLNELGKAGHLMMLQRVKQKRRSG